MDEISLIFIQYLNDGQKSDNSEWKAPDLQRYQTSHHIFTHHLNLQYWQIVSGILPDMRYKTVLCVVACHGISYALASSTRINKISYLCGSLKADHI